MIIDENTKANEIQVGGDHYGKKIQHWDMAVNEDLSYWTAAATKYIERWKQKNGVQDLEKALHYLIKELEIANGTFDGEASFENYVEAHNFDNDQLDIMRSIIEYERFEGDTTAPLIKAIRLLFDYINKVRVKTEDVTVNV